MEKAERINFVLNRKLNQRMTRNKEIMSILLPSFVRQKFLDGETDVIDE